MKKVVRSQDFTTLTKKKRLTPEQTACFSVFYGKLPLEPINFLKVRSFHPDNTGAYNFDAGKIRSEWSGPEGLKDLSLRREN